MPTDTDHAWAAGFLDGEGCFYIGRKGPRGWRVSLSASQNNRSPLDKLATMYGGTVHVQYHASEARRNVCWQWQVASAIALRRALPEILPHLVGKKEEAELIWEFVAPIRAGGKTRITPEEDARRANLMATLRSLR
jgi:hypothetical protein